MNIQKFSNEQIKDLIKEAEALGKEISLPLKQNKLGKEEIIAPSFFSKFLIPVCFCAFLFSAFYLYEHYQKDPLEEFAVKENLLSKKLSLTRNVPTSFLQVENAIETLKQARDAAFDNVYNEMSALLEANKIGPLENFRSKFDEVTHHYIAIEEEQAQKIGDELTRIFKEMVTKKKEEVELFQVIVDDSHLKPYVAEDLKEEILNVTRGFPKLKMQMKELHAIASRKKFS